MKAAVSSPNGLELHDIAQPVPKPNEVLTRVRACGLNRADLSAARARLGHGAMGAPVGLEWAGEVVAVGSDVTGFKKDQQVVECVGGFGLERRRICPHCGNHRLDGFFAELFRAALRPCIQQLGRIRFFCAI